MKIIHVKYFKSVVEAELAKNLLDSERIKVIIQTRGISGVKGIPTISGGADLFVLEKDVEKTKGILDAFTK